MKKILLLGVILTAFLMVLTPCISAVSIQKEKTAIETQEIQTKDEKESELNPNIETKNIESTGFLRNIIVRILGLAYIVTGLAATAVSPLMMIVGLPMMAFSSWLTGNNIFRGLLDGIFFSLSTPFIGLLMSRMGLYMVNPMNEPRFPTDEEMDEWFINGIIEFLESQISIWNDTQLN